MPKAILEFNLPDDDYDYKAATNAVNYLQAIEEFTEYLRKIIKYGGHLEGLTEEQQQTIVTYLDDSLRPEWFRIIYDRDL